jgi:hypothetical protein
LLTPASKSADLDITLDAGELLAATGRSDVIDASIILIAFDGDEIITSDCDDLAPLAIASGRHVELVSP